jgi:hypothetical protein
MKVLSFLISTGRFGDPFFFAKIAMTAIKRPSTITPPQAPTTAQTQVGTGFFAVLLGVIGVEGQVLSDRRAVHSPLASSQQHPARRLQLSLSAVSQSLQREDPEMESLQVRLESQ